MARPSLQPSSAPLGVPSRICTRTAYIKVGRSSTKFAHRNLAAGRRGGAPAARLRAPESEREPQCVPDVMRVSSGARKRRCGRGATKRCPKTTSLHSSILHTRPRPVVTRGQTLSERFVTHAAGPKPLSSRLRGEPDSPLCLRVLYSLNVGEGEFSEIRRSSNRYTQRRTLAL
jgi:hypothetical protein